jgi:hypothetical protein
MGDPNLAARNRRAMYNMMLDIQNYTAARDLTQEEARDIAVSYVLNNLLVLEKPVTFGADGSPTYPRIGEKPKLKLENIGGAKYVPDNKAAAGLTMTGPMDLRAAVLAVRLSRYLREDSRWGVSTIFWGGMGYGRDPNDRHAKGFALDFHGAVTRFGRFDVATDWGQQTITLPNGSKANTWPANVKPYYRLDVDTNPGGFFYAVYHFMAGEARDNGRNTESSIGDFSYVLCPESPDMGLRQKHQDHIHCDVAQ